MSGATEDLWRPGFCPAGFQYCFGPFFPWYVPIPPCYFILEVLT